MAQINTYLDAFFNEEINMFIKNYASLTNNLLLQKLATSKPKSGTQNLSHLWRCDKTISPTQLAKARLEVSGCQKMWGV